MSARVFGCDDLRRHILSFLVHDRCMECHQPMSACTAQKTKQYQNIYWTRARYSTTQRVCNWCYHYVWEYA